MTSNPARISDWLTRSSRLLNAPASTRTREEAAVELHALLCHVLGKDRAWILAHPEQELSDNQRDILDGLLRQLAGGTPLPYLTGKQEFYGIEFNVTPAVLIPRPETELLVERALDWLKSNPTRRRAADVGTGSGCIAVTLAKLAADLRVTAVDLSRDALQVAQENARKHGTGVDFVQSNLLSVFAGPFDLICANLPYIPSSTVDGLAVTRYEPRLALDGGVDGLDLIAALLADLPRVLAAGGLALFEIEAGQGETARKAAQAAVPGWDIQVLPDYANFPRLLAVRRKPNRDEGDGGDFEEGYLVT